MDNCALVANPDQADTDGDGLGDACDAFFNFGFKGFLSPYAPPPKRFRGNRTIPLKWQYTGADGDVTDSAAADPTVNVYGPVACGDTSGGELVELAVEVVSPVDRPRHVLDKIGEYLEAGVRRVWVIDPRQARAVVYRSLSEVRELGPDDVLDGEDVLPGFRCVLREIL